MASGESDVASRPSTRPDKGAIGERRAPPALTDVETREVPHGKLQTEYSRTTRSAPPLERVFPRINPEAEAIDKSAIVSFEK